jgi:hypothetical protein
MSDAGPPLVIRENAEVITPVIPAKAYEDEHDPIDESEGTPQSIGASMLDQREMTRSRFRRT